MRSRARRFRGARRLIGRVSASAERPLGLSHHRLERRRLAHGEIGKHLAVELDAGLPQAVHELRIGQAVLARAGVDALDPQRPETALPVAAVAIGILQVLLDALDGDPAGVLHAAARALRGLADLLVTGLAGHTPLPRG